MLKKLLISVVLLGLITAGAAFFALQQVKTYVTTTLSIAEPQIITVASGSSFNRVVNQFIDAEWMTQSPFQRLLPRLYPELSNIKAGSFMLQPGMSFYQAFEHLNHGDEHHFSITFIEGSRFNEWMDQLAKAPYIEHQLAGLSEAAIAEKLNIDRDKLEGLFLAETYHYTLGTSDIELLKRAHKKLNSVLAQAWQQKQDKLPLKSSYEALILASIIEKETAIDDERERIASVFVNRLNKGMRLQTDPTVIYGMGESYDGNIRKKDLRTPTPYNTYVIKGLPPTPIAMAGKASIFAAVNPENSPYFYFVASGKGGHVFSKTLKQHNRAVRAYLKELRKNR